MDKHKGFTIVEMAVVIVVLAILAALVVLSWRIWEEQSVKGAMNSELTLLHNMMEQQKNFTNEDPDDLPREYRRNSIIDIVYRKTPYCLQASSKRGNKTFHMHISQDGLISDGVCS